MIINCIFTHYFCHPLCLSLMYIHETFHIYCSKHPVSIISDSRTWKYHVSVPVKIFCFGAVILLSRFSLTLWQGSLHPNISDLLFIRDNTHPSRVYYDIYEPTLTAFKEAASKKKVGHQGQHQQTITQFTMEVEFYIQRWKRLRNMLQKWINKPLS